MAGGLAVTEQVKYTSAPSFKSPGLRERPKDAFTSGGSGKGRKGDILVSAGGAFHEGP